MTWPGFYVTTVSDLLTDRANPDTNRATTALARAIRGKPRYPAYPQRASARSWAARLSGRLRALRRGLREDGDERIPSTSELAAFIDSLPELHKDPFDRILIAQATVEGSILLTSDALVAEYPGPIRKFRVIKNDGRP